VLNLTVLQLTSGLHKISSFTSVQTEACINQINGTQLPAIYLVPYSVTAKCPVRDKTFNLRADNAIMSQCTMHTNCMPLGPTHLQLHTVSATLAAVILVCRNIRHRRHFLIQIRFCLLTPCAPF